MGLVLLYSSGCVSHRVDDLARYNVDGIQYGITRGNFRARWWNFYERGRSFADGGFWKEAESDLRMALARRSVDNRTSRTYGLHFIPYFGNRELGVVLYHQGLIKKAIPFLEQSLNQDPTEKTEYYLNLCYQQVSKAINDRENPTLHIDDLPEITNVTTINVAGHAHDNQFIDSVIINDKAFSPVLKENQLRFLHAIDLVPGFNNIDVMAQDTSGNSISAKRTVILDFDPPLISIDSASPEQVVLTLTDEHPVKLIESKLRHLDLIRRKGNQFVFQPFPSEKVYYAEFEDIANNRNGIKIDPDYLQLGQHFREERLPANSTSPILLASTEISPGFISQRNIPNKAHQDSSNNSLRIEVNGLLPEMEVFQDSILVAGSVYGTFERLKFDGQVRLKRGKDTRFSFRKQLDMGANLIVLEVGDSRGRYLRKTFNINRLSAPEKNHALRAKVMLHPLGKEGGDRTLDFGDYSALLVELDGSGRFRLLENDRLDIIRKEFNLVTNGWIKTNTAAKLGRRFKVDYTLACMIRPTNDDVEIFGRIIDAESKRILASCDVYRVADTLSDFKDSYARFVKKLVQVFPVVESTVEETTNQSFRLSRLFSHNSDRRVTIDMGENSNIKRGMKFVAYHRTEPIKDPETGELIIRGKIIEDGELSALTVRKRFSHLHLRNGAPIGDAEYVVSR